MKVFHAIALVAFASACTPIGPEKFGDGGIDSGPLENLRAGIWVDSDGCDHWIIDDGVEGYLSARLDEQGRPVCSGVAPPDTAVGPFKAGQGIADIL